MSEQPPTQGHTRPYSETRERIKRSRTAAYVRLGIIALILILVLVFVVQNTKSVALSFLSAEFTAPAWLMLLMVLVLGGVIGWFLGVRRRKTKR